MYKVRQIRAFVHNVDTNITAQTIHCFRHFKISYINVTGNKIIMHVRCLKNKINYAEIKMSEHNERGIIWTMLWIWMHLVYNVFVNSLINYVRSSLLTAYGLKFRALQNHIMAARIFFPSPANSIARFSTA